MRRKLRLYLDTSVWSFAFADDAPDYQRDTLAFFSEARKDRYEIFSSSIVATEILRTRDTRKRDAMLWLFDEILPQMLPVSPESRALARHYLAAGVVPPRSVADELHVAIATVSEVPVVLSWNFKHLANLRRNDLFQAANLSAGYLLPVRITSPAEVANDER